MIERSLAIVSNKTRRGSLALRNDLRNSFRVERALEKRSLAIKSRLLVDRDRTLKALSLRSKQQEKDKKEGVGGTLGVLGGGALARRFFGRGRGGLGAGLPKTPKIPTSGASLSRVSRVGRLGKFSKIGPLAILGTGLDFAGRRAEGQTNLQAGVGAAGGLGGALAGAKYGAILGTAIGGPVGTVVGGIGGSIIGGLAGGRLADFFSGADRRRKFEERRVEISTQKTLFSSALDDLDRVLEKLESTPFFMAKKDEDDEGPERRFPFGTFFPKPKPNTPFLQQPLVQNIGYTAAAAGLLFLTAIAIGSTPGTPEDIALIAALKTAVAKSPFLMRLGKTLRFAPTQKPVETLIPGKQIPGISPKGLELRGNQILRDLGTFVKKQSPKITKGRTKIRNKKILRGQDKVTYSDKIDLQKLIEISKKANEKQIKIIKKYIKNRQKNINPKKKNIQKQLNLFRIPRNTSSTGGGTPTASLENEENNNIALAPTNNIFIMQQGDNNNQSAPQTQGGDSTIFIGGTDDPFSATLNMAQMEILQTA